MNKRFIVVVAIVFALGLMLGSAYVALAQSGNPPVPFGGPGWMRGRGGMMGGWGAGQGYTGTMPMHPGGMMGGWGAGQGYTGTMPMREFMMDSGGVHDQVWTAVAAKLGLTYDQLKTELQTKTLSQLAQEKGVTLDQLQETAKTAWTAAINKLVEDGKLTREQADAMISRMQSAGFPMLNGQGLGSCPGGAGGMMGGPRGPRGGRGPVAPPAKTS